MHLSLVHHSMALIFSDLDGTLLDHHNYSFEAASPMLASLRLHNVPVVLNTSKTAAEVKRIQGHLDIDCPFIVENGAAIYMPKHTFSEPAIGTELDGDFWVKRFAKSRSHWLDIIAELESDFAGQFEGFSQMSPSRIAQVTGLSESEAGDAAKRQFGEPLLWHGSDEQRNVFIRRVRDLGAFPLMGGRFLHICGNSNKGTAMTWLRDEYAQQWDRTDLKTIALGDGNNDIAMLEDADIAVRILSPVNPPPSLKRLNGVITTRLMGPEGWHEALASILPTLGTHH